jgi:hypothetical protein
LKNNSLNSSKFDDIISIQLLKTIKISIFFIGIILSWAFVDESHFKLEIDNPVKGKVYYYVNGFSMGFNRLEKKLHFINDSVVIFNSTRYEKFSFPYQTPVTYFDSLRYVFKRDSIHFESLITVDIAKKISIKLTENFSPNYIWISTFAKKPKYKKDSLSIYFKFDEYLSTIYKEFNIKIYHQSKLLKTKYFKYSDTSKSVSLLVSDYFFKNYSDSSELQIQLTIKSNTISKTKRIRRKIKYGPKYLEYIIGFERSIQKFNTENLFIKDDKLFFSRDTGTQIWKSHYKQIK